MSAILSAMDLTKIYLVGPGVRALERVSLEIEEGEFVALTGPSGSGKSTLLHILGGLERPTYGEVRLAGRSYSSLAAAELARIRLRRIGFVYQRFHLITELDALENVAIPMLLAGVRRAEAVARARELLEQVGMGARLRHYPYQLSGGEQQRVAIARALANRPDVVLCDEPTGSLDRRTADAILDLLQALHLAGQTIVIATHDPAVMERAGRIVRIADGRIAGDERVRKVVNT
ncbi:MAG: ABC transporter ATP-binding protein [Firmicutes bacterium]|nr:ABC transporter ATP-binding protein [Bacillota bacterium]